MPYMHQSDDMGNMILDAIDGGSFVTKVRNGDINSTWEIRVAQNNLDELGYWGTTPVPDH